MQQILTLTTFTETRRSSIGITPQQVIDYANRSTDLMTQAVAVAKETLEWTQAGPVQTFCFRTRQENRLNDQLISYRIALRKALLEFRHKQASDPVLWHEALTSHIAELQEETAPSFRERWPATPSKPTIQQWSSWEMACIAEQTKVKREKNKIQHDHDSNSFKTSQQKMQSQYWKTRNRYTNRYLVKQQGRH